jgi:hypothetical protein
MFIITTSLLSSVNATATPLPVMRKALEEEIEIIRSLEIGTPKYDTTKVFEGIIIIIIIMILSS